MSDPLVLHEDKKMFSGALKPHLNDNKSRKKTHTKTMHLLTISYKDIDPPQQENRILNWSLGTKQTETQCFVFTVNNRIWAFGAASQ